MPSRRAPRSTPGDVLVRPKVPGLDNGATAFYRLLWFFALTAAASVTSAYLLDPYGEPLSGPVCLALHLLAWGTVWVEWCRYGRCLGSDRQSVGFFAGPLISAAVIATVVWLARDTSFRCSPRGAYATYFALEDAVGRNDLPTVRTLLSGRASDADLPFAGCAPGFDRSGNRVYDPPKPLIERAVDAGEVGIAAALIEHGAGWRVEDRSFLARSACRGDIDMLRMLIAHGGSVTDTEFGRTPLQYAAAAGKENSVAFLLSRGADPNPPGLISPLAAAAQSSDTVAGLDILALLLVHGARVNETVRRSDALWYAVSAGHAEEVRFLLDHGANPYAISPESPRNTSIFAQNEPPRSVYDLARSANRAYILDLLLRHRTALYKPRALK